MTNVGDLRVKLQRVDRFRWAAVVEVYDRAFEKPDQWRALLTYSNGWRRAPFRWLVVALAMRDVRSELRRRRRSDRRLRYAATEFVDVPEVRP